jgi:hypothetical protein
METKLQKGNYIMFPVRFLSEMFSDAKGFATRALIFGIYKYADENNWSDEELAKKLSDMNTTSAIADYLHPYETEDDIFNNLLHDDFREDVEMLAKVALTMDYFELGGDYLQVTEKGGLDYSNRVEREPMVPMSVTVLQNASRSKAKDVYKYAVYFAMRSMLGDKPVWFTSLECVMARAFGFTNIQDVPDEVKKHELYQIALDPNRRRHRKKLMDSLRDEFHVQNFADHTRGFAFAIGEAEALKRCIDKVKERKLKPMQFEQMAKNARAEIKAAKERLRAGVILA